jgi:hypothetical protein
MLLEVGINGDPTLATPEKVVHLRSRGSKWFAWCVNSRIVRAANDYHQVEWKD